MKISIFVKAVLILFLLNCSGWGSSFNKKHDVQLWEFQQISCEINKKTSLYFQTEFRWGDDISVLYFSYIQTGIIFKTRDWLDIAPGYRHSSVLARNHVRTTTYNPFLDIIFKFNIQKWKLNDRNRVEYLIPEVLPNSWVYRNRIHLLSPWKWGKCKLNPFVFNEFFFREQTGFSQNRFALGGRFALAKTVKSDIFYMLRHIKFPNWRPTHVLGAYLFFTY